MEKIADEIVSLMVNIENDILRHARGANRNYKIWRVLQFITIITGLTTSIVVVVSLNSAWTVFTKIICVSLPLMGSIAAALNSFYRPLEIYNRKTNAKIEFRNLLSLCRIQLNRCNSPEEYQNLFEKITLEKDIIENKQDKKV